MDAVRLSSLLQADEEKVKSELRADAVVDQSRRQSITRLNDLFSQLLLRYNAENAEDPMRQALADCQAAPVRDMIELLNAGTAKKETEKRRVRASAVICLLLAVICALSAALLVRTSFPAGIAFTAACGIFGFLGGLLWYGEREVHVQAGLDPEVIWRTVKKTVDTMDRKADEFLAQADTLEQSSSASSCRTQPSGLSPEDLKLYGDLLEALYSENGDYALRQLKKLPVRLRAQGVELCDYTESTAELFEILPTKNTAATLRPALVREGELLLAGRATEPVLQAQAKGR